MMVSVLSVTRIVPPPEDLIFIQDARTAKNQLFPPSPHPSTDEAARQRSLEAVSSLASHADGKGVGLKMLSSMGFGSEGLGLGKNAQVSV